LRVLLLLILNLIQPTLAENSGPVIPPVCDEVFQSLLKKVISRPEQDLIHTLTLDPVLEVTYPRVQNTLEKPVILNLKSGKKLIFKNNEIGGRSRGMNKEVAAFLFDRMLNANLVPTTFIREENAIRGSAQVFIEGYHRTHSVYKTPDLQIFDFLIDTHDRASENVIWTKFGRPYAIDHGFTFVPTPNPIPVTEASREFLTKTAKRCPRFIKQLRKVKDAEIASILRPLIGEESTDQLLIRKQWLLDRIDSNH